MFPISQRTKEFKGADVRPPQIYPPATKRATEFRCRQIDGRAFEAVSKLLGSAPAAYVFSGPRSAVILSAELFDELWRGRDALAR